nr:7TM diverse intracellular signaling domain-containing protein [uncultured Cohaesibacter sp.]
MKYGLNSEQEARGIEVALVSVILLFCAILWMVFSTTDNKTIIDLEVRDGVATIPETPLDHGAIFALSGPWQVYWGHLFTPDDLQRPDAPEPSGSLRLPWIWRGHSFGDEIAGGTGAATFHLRLTPPASNTMLTLRLFDLRLAYRLWANGTLVAESGKPGLDAANEQPDRSLVLAPLETTGQPVDLVLQMSNHGFREGGIGDPILLAKAGILQNARDRVWIFSAFFCGVLLVAGTYHLLIYFLRPRDISFFYFGMYCLLIIGYAANSNSTYWLSRAIVPGWINPVALDELALVCYVMSGAILYRFYRSLFPSDFSRRLQMVSDLRIVVFLLSALALPPVWHSWLIMLLMLAGLLFTTYYLVRLFVCIVKRQPGAILLFSGAVVLALTSIHDVLVHTDVIEGEYMVLTGLFALVVFQSSALALHYAQSFLTVELLSEDLHHNLDALKAEMNRRRELEAEVVWVSEEERRRVSYQIHDGLCQQLTAARLRYSMLSNVAAVKDIPAMVELGRVLAAATEDAYALSRGMWPVEHDSALTGPTIEELVDSARRTGGIEINLRQNWPCASCTGEHLSVFHRIAQEAIANAVRHAGATRVDVSLDCEGGLTRLEVKDDGAGLPADLPSAGTGGLGLRIMRYRASAIGAEFSIDDAPGGGTVVRCHVQCHNGTCAEGAS